MSGLIRRFLDWNRPLADQAAGLLLSEVTGDPPDLRGVLVVVSTRQAARRLRQRLAWKARDRGGALFPPTVVTPEAIAKWGNRGRNDLATEAEGLAARARVLEGLKLDAWRAIFPVEPPERDAGWAFRAAEDLMALQVELAEGGLAIGDVATRLGRDHPEAARWEQFGRLERLFVERLADWEKVDPELAAINAASESERPEGVERVILLAVPDPLPLTLRVLNGWSRHWPVEVWMHGPDEDDAFDDYGRPCSGWWLERAPPVEAGSDWVHLCRDPGDQADRLAGLAAGYSDGSERLALVSADSEVTEAAVGRLRAVGIEPFSPAGVPWAASPPAGLVENILALALTDSVAPLAPLLRRPEILGWLGRTCDRHDEGFVRRILEQWDRLYARHIPGTLAGVRGIAVGRVTANADLAPALDALADALAALRSPPFGPALSEFMENLYLGKRFRPAVATDARTVASAECLIGKLREVERVEGGPGDFGRWTAFVRRLMGRAILFPERPEGAREISGWLELPWIDAPHLAAAGINDGRVPEHVAGDAYLPHGLREALGLRTNDERQARDVYLLHTAFRSRRSDGRVDLLFGKTARTGEPLRPSPILLTGGGEDLARRVRAWFGDPPPARTAPAWRRTWKLAPARVDPPERLAVTDFRAYLRCPFRFSLERIVGLDRVDPDKQEMDALDFGNLCHRALQEMGSDPSMNRETRPDRLKEFLIARVDRDIRDIYGENPPLPVRIQAEAARQRLVRAAEVQALASEEGWEIIEVEWKFPRDSLRLAGLSVAGTVDRIERHRESGLLRVLDYKTSDQPATPESAHLTKLKRKESPEDFAEYSIVVGGSAIRRWADLQLPLYLEVVGKHFEGEAVGGYFSLPKAVTETAIEIWTGLDDALREAARICAEGVAADIAAGNFWPPREDPEFESLEGMVFQGTADTFDPPRMSKREDAG